SGRSVLKGTPSARSRRTTCACFTASVRGSPRRPRPPRVTAAGNCRKSGVRLDFHTPPSSNDSSTVSHGNATHHQTNRFDNLAGGESGGGVESRRAAVLARRIGRLEKNQRAGRGV